MEGLDSMVSLTSEPEADFLHPRNARVLAVMLASAAEQADEWNRARVRVPSETPVAVDNAG
jgi:hypothetical protein